jgi:hypothetical protein
MNMMNGYGDESGGGGGSTTPSTTSPHYQNNNSIVKCESTPPLHIPAKRLNGNANLPYQSVHNGTNKNNNSFSLFFAFPSWLIIICVLIINIYYFY